LARLGDEPGGRESCILQIECDPFGILFVGYRADAKLVKGEHAVIFDGDELLVIDRESEFFEIRTGSPWSTERTANLHTNARTYLSPQIRLSAKDDW
jgi:hypothetical protein